MREPSASILKAKFQQCDLCYSVDPSTSLNSSIFYLKQDKILRG